MAIELPATWAVHAGDSRGLMSNLPHGSIDSIVCDPPYELGFMGKRWDASGIAYDANLWREALRVLKPGGHLLAFGGTRTYHRMACAIEDAGFEIRDSLHWVYGTGFPKSLNVGKALDEKAGATREVVGPSRSNGLALKPGKSTFSGEFLGDRPQAPDITAPATPEAAQWEGWGTALKPAHEPIVLARKPLGALTVGENVLRHGTGALNVDGCRIEGIVPRTTQGQSDRAGEVYGADQRDQREFVPNEGGRWPANFVLDPDAAQELDAQSGFSKTPEKLTRGAGGQHGSYSPIGRQEDVPSYGDSGGASRFFYVAKPSKGERDAGLEAFEAKMAPEPTGRTDGPGEAGHTAGAPVANRRKNIHPTVKPIALMRWLCRLVTPPGGIVLDPFAGSGTTGCAARLEGFRFLGFELSDEYSAIARARIAHWDRPGETPVGCQPVPDGAARVEVKA